MSVIKSSNVLAENWLAIARDKTTSPSLFTSAIDNIGLVLFSEAVSNLDSLILKKNIRTPLKETSAKFLDQEKIFLIPVLRAGLSMLPGIKKLVPEAKVIHVGLYRDEETLKPYWYLNRLPKKVQKNSVFFILEPMLATAGTVSAVLNEIMLIKVKKICVLSVIMSNQAQRRLEDKFSKVNFYVAGIDPRLNSRGYIVPGLGDAGDRAFNT